LGGNAEPMGGHADDQQIDARDVSGLDIADTGP
jgi:hypothetical protein